MKRPLILVILFVLVSTGCAERTKFQSLLGSWVGSNETQLIRNWGEPDNIISEGHTRYLVYRNSGPPRTGTQDYSAAAATGCLITFESLDEIIVSSRYEGDKCGVE